MQSQKPDLTHFKHYEISDEEFEYLRKLIYREAGINLTPAKKCLAQTRIGKLMRKKGIDGYKNLFHILENDKSGYQLEMVLDAISTNHTFFFREDAHFSYLNDHILPGMRNKGLKEIDIWSAGCSSGEEPYTIAMSILESKIEGKNTEIRFSIDASDISTEVLKKAKAAVYLAESIQELPYNIKKRYFKRGKDRYLQYVKVKDDVQKYVRFSRKNLLLPNDDPKKYHIIFCRNVMIYFDRQTKERVVANLAEKLHYGGYLVTGHSESLNGITHSLNQEKPTIYRKGV